MPAMGSGLLQPDDGSPNPPQPVCGGAALPSLITQSPVPIRWQPGQVSRSCAREAMPSMRPLLLQPVWRWWSPTPRAWAAVASGCCTRLLNDTMSCSMEGSVRRWQPPATCILMRLADPPGIRGGATVGRHSGGCCSLVHLSDKYGRLPLDTTLQGAIPPGP